MGTEKGWRSKGREKKERGKEKVFFVSSRGNVCGHLVWGIRVGGDPPQGQHRAPKDVPS